MRSRIAALVAVLIACVLSVGVASALATQGGNGSGSTATAGPGNSSQGCDGSHNSDTGHGANQSGPYDNTCDGSPSGNGNGNGQATGKPCAGCVGNADDKNPKGQMPNGSDHNAGYECDRNHGIGRTNPAHTGCNTTTPSSCPAGQTCGGSSGCPAGQDCGGGCPSGSNCGNGCPSGGNCGNGCPSGTSCNNGCPTGTDCGNKCPDGSAAVNGNCGKNETPPPATTTTPPPGQQAVLGERESGTTPKTAPESTTGSSPEQKVLGESESGSAPTSATAPAAATQARPASSNKSLPFTGTDLIVVLLAGAIALTAGLALRRLASHRA